MSIPELELETLEATVLDKCDSFARLGLWPKSEIFNYRAWLSNFDDETTLKYALYLLNSFVFYNKDLCIELLYGCLRQLSTQFQSYEHEESAVSSWSEYLETSLFVPIEGEDPNITDSGNYLAHHLRKSIGLNESQILAFSDAHEVLLADPGTYHRIVFFDDLVGSGAQTLTMLSNDGLSERPIQQLIDLNTELIYISLVSTQYGKMNIRNGNADMKLVGIPELNTISGHIINGQPRILQILNQVWPTSLHEDAESFLVDSANKCGADNPFGFHDLGLTLAFEHTIPDATLPIFYAESNDWKPLMRRI